MEKKIVVLVYGKDGSWKTQETFTDYLQACVYDSKCKENGYTTDMRIYDYDKNANMLVDVINLLKCNNVDCNVYTDTNYDDNAVIIESDNEPYRLCIVCINNEYEIYLYRDFESTVTTHARNKEQVLKAVDMYF